MEKKIIFKFLDEYLGDELSFKRILKHDGYDNYEIISKKNGILLYFVKVNKMHNSVIKLFGGPVLCNTLSSFFSLSSEDAGKFISSWFGEKYNIIKVKEMVDLIHSSEIK